MTTLVFSTSGAFVSRAIAWFTGSKASHVMIGFNLFEQPMLLHCTAGGVQVTPRAKWFKENKLVAEYEFRPNMEGALRRGLDLIGTQYDYLTLFGWGGVILLWRLFKIRAKNPLQSSRAMVCSEFVARVGQGEVIEWQDLNPETTHCQTLLDRLPSASFVELTGLKA